MLFLKVPVCILQPHCSVYATLKAETRLISSVWQLRCLYISATAQKDCSFDTKRVPLVCNETMCILAMVICYLLKLRCDLLKLGKRCTPRLAPPRGILFSPAPLRRCAQACFFSAWGDRCYQWPPPPRWSQHGDGDLLQSAVKDIGGKGGGWGVHLELDKHEWYLGKSRESMTNMWSLSMYIYIYIYI